MPTNVQNILANVKLKFLHTCAENVKIYRNPMGSWIDIPVESDLSEYKADT